MAIVAFQFPATKLCGCHLPSSSRIRLTGRRPRIRFLAEAAATGDEVEVSSSSGGSATLPSSLISADNVQKALRGIAITDVDHYGRLGIARNTSYDEEPEDVEPTRLVGYFLLAWIILSFALSVTLNR
ncbi:unnamed protein product [Spirodela intermedia]|uniref:Uncharacterized protein n=1 Tax=Spirodela intermedia TaxID=51605 RepID=A0A7I8J392_SPIIN|nr:unnamed protein product [Spirodela intermedia]CAA6664677.1 unnamed protein product [Spirodela intermedia]